MTHDDPEGEFPSDGFVAVPKEVAMRILKEYHSGAEGAKMATESMKMRKELFLRKLDPEDLFVLAYMIKEAGEDKQVAAYVNGEISAIMRYVHGVDPATGEHPGEYLHSEKNGE